MASRALTIDITTADAQTIAALKRIQKELRDTGTTAERTSKSGTTLGNALGGLAIGAGLSVAIGEFEEAETTLRKTEAVIKSTGNAAGVSAEQQAKMVEEFSKLAAVDDEVVAGGANILRTFTQIKGEAFEPALGAALDLSAALGTDLQSASLQVGKALNDPTKGVTALTRAGVSFTAQQKEQIKAMQAAGDVAGAQRLILAELENQFGGQAEAAATDSAKMRVAFGNAAESLGGALAPALSATANVAEKASSAFQSLPQPAQQAGLALGALAIVGPKVAHGFNEIREATTDAEGATTRMGRALGAGGVVAGAAAGVLALNEYRKATSGLKVDIEGVLGATDEAIARSLMEARQFADQGDFEKVGRQNIDALYAMRDALKANGEEAIPELDAAIKVVEAELKRAEERTKKYAEANTDAVGPVTDLAAAIGAVNGVIAQQYGEGVRANQAYAGYLQATLDVNAAVVDVAEAQDKLTDSTDAVADAERSAADASEAIADARRGVADAEAAVADAREGVVEAVERVAEAERDAADAADDVATAVLDLADAQRDALPDSERMAEVLADVQDAQEALTRANEDAAVAQQALDDVTSNYAQTLQGLKDDAADAADAITLANLDLADAQAKLANLGADGEPVTEADRVRAQLAVEAIRRRIRGLEQRQRDAQEAVDRNDDGVESSDAYAEAQDRVSDASDRQSEAQGRLEDAVLAVADSQVEANERVQDAQAALADKIQARADADQRVVDARGAVVDANEAVDRAVQGVAEAHRGVASAADGAREAQKRLSDARGEVITAQGEVERAVEAVRDALEVQATSWAGVLVTFSFDGALRKSIRGITGEMRELAGNYDVNVNLGGNAASAILSGVSNPFLDVLAAVLGVDPATGGRSAPGGKGGGIPSGTKGETTAPAPAAPTGPRTKPGGWVEQANGRWWRPRRPGEANYGDGYVDYDEMLRMIQAEEAAAAPSRKPDPGTGPGKAGEVVIKMDVRGVEDPAATAEMVSRRLGWELSRLIGAA